MILKKYTLISNYEHSFRITLLLLRVSGNLVGISINLCKSIYEELFINDTP